MTIGLGLGILASLYAIGAAVTMIIYDIQKDKKNKKQTTEYQAPFFSELANSIIIGLCWLFALPVILFPSEEKER